MGEGSWFKGHSEHLWIIIDMKNGSMHRIASTENMTQITNHRCGSLEITRCQGNEQLFHVFLCRHSSKKLLMHLDILG